MMTSTLASPCASKTLRRVYSPARLLALLEYSTIFLVSDSLLYSDDSIWSSFSSADDTSDDNSGTTPSVMQSWDGLDGSLSLFDNAALSSLPFGDVEAEEAAAAASEGVPTYRGSDSSFSASSRAGVPPTLPTARVFKKPGTQTQRRPHWRIFS